ncbi:MAG: tRNA (N(6)-L-threonylcarbamoyladenosine(37)-C(2))-methylthiotransferase MtaB [Lachnospiraceae bacterium]|nr:tRNA (N(6)-L-threonylcarbamoyladenosine(37)-C(2))-methylthiotransferase MtaB [Lachnospiraceae bacterium]
MSEINRKTAAVCTMGCKVNSYESQGMIELLERDGYTLVDFSEPADVYLINTCTVTQIAARKSRQMIHRARNLNPEALVVAAGCYVDRDDSLLKEGVIDLAVPNRRKKDLILYIEAKRAGKELPDPDETEPYTEMAISRAEGGRTRAFLKVQDGCRQFCTYCIIPYVRGPLLSRPMEECVEEARILSEAGCREIVLTGIHLSSYGRDLKEKGIHCDAGDLIAAIAALDKVERIRLGSLEPRLITPEFLEKISGTDKLCPHFHLSLQSGCDRTLKAMNRKYTSDEFREAVKLLRQHFPDVAVTTDVIAGFPGETEEDHLESLAFVREMGFAEAHVFPYSRMEGTVAARKPDQVSSDDKKRRSRELLAVTAQSSVAFMEGMQGKTVKVILEEKDPDTGLWTGYSPNYMRIGVMLQESQSGSDLQGQELEVRICGYVNKRSANHDASGLDSILKGERI